MLSRIFPNKDTFITDEASDTAPASGSNMGAAENLKLFKLTPNSGSNELSRILMQFDLSSFSSVPTGSVRYYLNLKNLQHSETVPSSFDVEVQALSQSWDEGSGIDSQDYFDQGYANWDKRKSNAFWITPGAIGSGSILVSHFDTGLEDMRLDVTNIVNTWLSGSENDGFLIKLSSSIESGSQEYYVKMFYSKDSFFSDKRPYLEAVWNDTVQTGSVELATGDGPWYVNVTNLKDQYAQEESVKLRLFNRYFDYNPAVVLTASSGPTGIAFDSAYYRMMNDRTDEIVVPFGTGTIEYTKLSYDANGNYFYFDMSSLSAGNVYRIEFLLNVSGQKHVVNEQFKFRVV